ncbi:MAG: hypothetical protein NT023_13550 [Armatimonadetes bacterium]|nr:hypothetical protein [Armatimonadota bacterium]
MTFTPEQVKAYRAAREQCAWRERNDLGFIEVRGADRYTWLQGMLSQELRLLEQGASSAYAYFLNATGHILAELKIVRFAKTEGSLLLVTTREIVGRLMEQLDRFLIMEDVELRDVSDEITCFELYGREVEVSETLSKIGYAHRSSPSPELIEVCQQDEVSDGGAEWCRILNSFVVYTTPNDFVGYRNALQTQAIPEIDAAVAEVLRIEGGIPRYPNELNESVIALEANNAATHISFTKGCYVGQEIIARIDSRGHTNRALTGFIGLGSATFTEGEKVFSCDDNREIGRLTSALNESPLFSGKAIALGYLRHEFREAGTVVLVRGTGVEAKAIVVELPFASLSC